MNKMLVLTLILFTCGLFILVEHIPNGIQAKYLGTEETYPAYCGAPRMVGVRGPATLELEIDVKQSKNNALWLDVLVNSAHGGTPIILRPRIAAVINLDSKQLAERKIWIDWHYSAAGKQETIQFTVHIGVLSESGYEIILPSFLHGETIWAPAPLHVVYSPAFFRWRPLFCK